MARLPRWIPEDSLVEVSCRCIQARFLLRPSVLLNALFIGVLAKALLGTGIELHAIVVLSGHYHFLATVPSTGVLARAMRFLNGNLPKEVGWLHRWRGKLWAGRYHASFVDDDEATQISRLEYLLSNGCKENLVWKPGDWPGVQGVRAVLEGLPLVGTWISRKSQWAAKNRRGADASDAAHSEELSVELVPLPCWRHLPDAEARARSWRESKRYSKPARGERHPPARSGQGAAGRSSSLSRESRVVAPAARARASSQAPLGPLVGARECRGRLLGCFSEVGGRRSKRGLPRRDVPARPALRADQRRSTRRRLTRLQRLPSVSRWLRRGGVRLGAEERGFQAASEVGKGRILGFRRPKSLERSKSGVQKGWNWRFEEFVALAHSGRFEK